MSEIYRCDRCGTTIPLTTNAAGWSVYTLRLPQPVGERSIDPPAPGHLCGECSQAFAGWLTRGKLP